MTPEDKQLLIKDLCARLPYKVIVEITSDGGMVEASYDMRLDAELLADLLHSEDDFKPYLRSLSSITEEEKKELGNFVAAGMFASQNKNPLFQLTVEALYGDFFNKHHIDYRGLIPMGLALEAKEGMYES